MIQADAWHEIIKNPGRIQNSVFPSGSREIFDYSAYISALWKLIYCLPTRRQRPNATSTIFAHERAVFEFESFDWSPSRASYAWIVRTRWRNLLDPFEETWMKWWFWTINCFINTFFLLRRTDCSVLCLFIFVLWLCKLEVHSLFSKRPLVYGKLLSAYYMCSLSLWAVIAAWTAFY